MHSSQLSSILHSQDTRQTDTQVIYVAGLDRSIGKKKLVTYEYEPPAGINFEVTVAYLKVLPNSAWRH